MESGVAAPDGDKGAQDPNSVRLHSTDECSRVAVGVQEGAGINADTL